MLDFEKEKYKLYNLQEALSLDNLDDFVSSSVDEPDNSLSDIIEINELQDFAKSRIFNEIDTPLKPLEKILINNVNNDVTDEFTGKIIVNNTHELVQAVRNGAKYFGLNGNFNWINTSKITNMLNLFITALGDYAKKFNGDISKWDVSNVTNMMYIFKNCSSLTCDISNWDTTSVKYWSSASYNDTPASFKKICQKLKMPNKVLRIASWK